MGLDVNGTRFLMFAKAENVDFSQSAMLGRQWLNVTAAELAENLSEFGLPGAEQAEAIIAAEQGYGEGLFRHLGAREVASFDVNSYEKPTYMHDFNQPIGAEFHEKFSVVLDGGSLEHIFNFPVAIRNCMEMVRVGGCFLGINPANNALGHGFYQFSPDLYYRVFSQQNGFRIEHLLLHETNSKTWFEVADPLRTQMFDKFVNGRETYQMVIARRTTKVPLFQHPLEQSLYSRALWSTDAPHATPPSPRQWSFGRLVPELFKRPVRELRWYRRLQHPFDKTNHYQPVRPRGVR